MADVSKVEKLKAGAVGGPSAAAEYAAQQSAVVDLKQQALSDAAARGGQINAPEQFMNAQAGRLSVPLDAAATSLGTQAGAAGAYGAAQSAAQGGYMGAVQASQGLIAQRMQRDMEDQYSGIYSKLAAQKKAAERSAIADAKAEEADQKRMTNEIDKSNKDQGSSRKTFAAQDAAADAENVTPNTYKVIADVLNKADDLETAKRLISLYSMDNLDEEGGEVDSDAVLAYIMKGLDPDAFASALQQEPEYYGKFAR